MESGEEARARVRAMADRIADFAVREGGRDYDIVIYVRDRKSTPSILGKNVTAKFRLTHTVQSLHMLPIIGQEIQASIERLMDTWNVL